MPKVLINRPNRTTKRYFQTCDVARIAQECFLDGQGTKDEIMRCVSKALGYKKMAVQKDPATVAGFFRQVLAGLLAEITPQVESAEPFLGLLAGFVNDGTVTKTGAHYRIVGVFYAILTRVSLLTLSGLVAVLTLAMQEMFAEYDLVDTEDLESPESKLEAEAAKDKKKRRTHNKRCNCPTLTEGN